jgi:anti-sigma regulatory factor (Ser/Thr protein kinase)
MRRAETFAADAREIKRIYSFIEGSLMECTSGENRASQDVINKLRLAADEIFSNIVKHGFTGARGLVEVGVGVDVRDGSVEIEFLDDGVPFNPLSAAPPDTSLGLSEREAGGLGIFLVRRLMDEVAYSRKDGRNSLTIKIFLGERK